MPKNYDKEPEKWITVNGVHVPIFKGESEKDISNKIKEMAGVKKEKNEPATYNAKSFEVEAKRQGLKLDADDIEDYVSSSYGNTRLGDKISRFIDNCPDGMKVGDEELYRGMYFDNKKEFDDFIKNHAEGKILESRRDGLSWTTDKSVAKEFSSEAGDYSVMLVNTDDAKNAISIKNIADTPSSSSEVLYSSSTDFEVVEVERKGNTAILYVTEAVMSKTKYKE